MRIGIIGAGHIGSELYRRAKLLNWDVRFVLRSDGVYKDLAEKIGELENYIDFLDDIDIGFLAIPTLDDGRIAFEYMKSLLGRDIPIVTCEKGALSNYFSDLENNLGEIGYSATVGGGTRLLRYLEEIMNEYVEEMHSVMNGTLNYIFSELSSGRSLGEVVNETKTLGYAEPQAETPLEVINQEATGDVPMKCSILYNICFGRLVSERMRAKDVRPQGIEDRGLKKLIREAGNRRYIVSITKENNEEDVIGGFKHKVGDWNISAGFKNKSENPLFLRLIPSGVNNAVLVSEGLHGIDGTYILSGPGAGAGPTASSMIKDAIKLLSK
jgi:homoserine dehydrogenase